MLDPDQIETRYADSGGLKIAFQIFGQGDLDLVFIPGWVSNVEHVWTMPEFAEFGTRLARFARVVLIDRRGTGLSDPIAGAPTLEERMDDVRAVMDAVGWQRAVIWGTSEGGQMAILFAASFPERTRALLLYGTFARIAQSNDYQFGVPDNRHQKWMSLVDRLWGKGELSKAFAPNRAHDVAFVKQMGKLERMAMSPGTASKLFRISYETDVRHVLPSVRVPTLILHRLGDQVVSIERSRYLADHIQNAQYVELPGDDHIPWIGDQQRLIDEARQFLTGDRPMPDVDRVLTTILFCDIVDSTAHAARIGDLAWRAVLERFYALADGRLRVFRGRKLDTAGDGLFAAFDGPARAVRCGVELCTGASALGLQLRVGVHTGECEVLGEKYSGIAVHLGARVAASAEPGQVVVSSTVKDLVAGSGITFRDLGMRELRGVPGAWNLYCATV